jgi:hypothetical protein
MASTSVIDAMLITGRLKNNDMQVIAALFSKNARIIKPNRVLFEALDFVSPPGRLGFFK